MSAIGELNFVMLHVPGLEEAKAYYTGKLGFEIEEEQPGFVQFKQTPTGAIFALLETPDATTYQGLQLWWHVPDADGVYRQLVERGVEIASPPKDEPFGRALSIKDPANNTLYIFQLPTAA